jgi:hypothetical protein
MDERRRAERLPVSIPARLLLSGGRETSCVIRNVGELGVLIAVTDLETEIHEGERALLEHPRIVDGNARKQVVRTPGAVVRVELDMEKAAVVRQVALYFDGGPSPESAD